MPHNVPSPLLTHLHTAKDQPAIIENGRTYSWSDIEIGIRSCKGWLAENGISFGDRVAVVPSGSYAEIIFFLACCDMGVVFCGLNSRFPTKTLELMTGQVNAKTVDHNQINESFVNAKQIELANKWDLDQSATVIYSSGSTGQPKAILHTLGNHYFNAIGSNQNIPLAPGDRWQFSLPLYHVSGMGIIFRTLLSGAAIVLNDKSLSVKQIIRDKVTHLSLVSTQFQRLLSESNVKLLSDQLKAILLGGGPLSRSDIARGMELGLPIFTSYGLSEMASQVATSLCDQADENFATILPHREVKIGDAHEILVRGKTLFAGYLDGNNVDPARDAEGWFHTRDVGELNGNQLRVVGRLDNQFISGGENIQPEMIEQELTQIPGIQIAVVVPIPDAEFGHRPVAFLSGATDFDVEKLNEVLSRKLPRFMLPIQYTALPDEALIGLKPDRMALKKVASELFNH